MDDRRSGRGAVGLRGRPPRRGARGGDRILPGPLDHHPGTGGAGSRAGHGHRPTCGQRPRPQEIAADGARGDSDNEAFNRNLRAAGVADAVRHVRLPSADALGEVRGELDLLYVDGAHRYGPAREDIERWGARLKPGGVLLVHDGFSSIGVTLAQMRLLLLGSRFRYLGRAGSLVRYRREDLASAERGRNALRQAAQLPWFARNLLVKVAIVCRLRPLAQALGHRDGPWPY